MMKTYHIERTALPGAVPPDSPLWLDAPRAEIDSFAWDGGEGYRPRACVRLLAGKAGLSALFTTDETPLRAVCAEQNGRICCDSCVEFFLRPQHDARYLNFEMNPAGMMMIGLGEARANRTLLPFDPADFCLSDRIENGIWRHLLYIPFEFLHGIYGGWTDEFFGNLYKCGDETIHPHYGSWNPVDTPNPDFHAPQCFGKFILGA